MFKVEIDALRETAFTCSSVPPPSSSSAGVEFGFGFKPKSGLTHAIFDFDGTLAWLRHGWPQIMLELFCEHTRPGPGESVAALRELLLDDILSLNGKPSIFQMARCAERARERNDVELDPELLLREYQSRLERAISERSQKITNGAAAPDEFVVRGARAMLERLKALGFTLVILSGTAEHRVKEEAALLDLARYFGPHIYGGTADLAQSSKSAVLRRLLASEGIQGGNLLCFGDGPVEIQLTRDLGGLAVGVASDEERNDLGIPDSHKRRILLGVGADLIIADYAGAEGLLESILGP